AHPARYGRGCLHSGLRIQQYCFRHLHGRRKRIDGQRSERQPERDCGIVFTQRRNAPGRSQQQLRVDDAISELWREEHQDQRAAAQPTHTYALAGSYTISVKVDDGRGGAQLSASTTLLVNTPPQVITPADADFNPTGFDTQTTFSVVAAGNGTNDADGDALVYN